MAVTVLTTDDLHVFKLELLSELKDFISSHQTAKKELLKSKDVREMLGISHGTLQTLRINGTLSYTKVGGTLYYEREDVMKAVNLNKHNATSNQKKKEMCHGK
jgi:hypothetical protein